MKSTVGWAQFKLQFIDRRAAKWAPTKLQKWSPVQTATIRVGNAAPCLMLQASTGADLHVLPPLTGYGDAEYGDRNAEEELQRVHRFGGRRAAHAHP